MMVRPQARPYSRCIRRIASLLFMLIVVFGGELRPESPPFKSYTTEEGLAHDNVNKIVRDSRGFLWFCTAEGLSRFDGSRFTNFTTDQGLLTQAYLYGFPLVFNLDQVTRYVTDGVGANPAAPFNTFSHARHLAGHDEAITGLLRAYGLHAL